MAVFLHPRSSVRPKVQPKRVRLQFDRPVIPAGQAGPIKIFYDTALGQVGAELAARVTPLAQAGYDYTSSIFSTIKPPAVNLIIGTTDQSQPDPGDGTGGAYHTTCAATDLYCNDALQPGGESRTAALFVAELAEVFMSSALQWGCGFSTGEGLSRCVAEKCFPTVLDDFHTFDAWLDGGRPNWVTTTDSTDEDPISTGCSVGFLFWLLSRGYTLAQIVLQSGDTLAALYKALTGMDSALSDFRNDCETRWPAAQPSGVVTDNPW